MNYSLHISRTSVLGAILLTLGVAPQAWVEQSEAVASGIHPSYLRCEYRVDPLGIDVVHPRLSWVLESDKRDQVQTGYQVRVGDVPLAVENDVAATVDIVPTRPSQ